MANHFDVVSVRANDECCIVFPAVVRTQTGRAIVLGARLQRRAMESLHLLAILGHERQVEMRRLLLGWEEAQRRLAVRAQLDAEGPLRDYRHADRFECPEEERFARCIVADSEYGGVIPGFCCNG